MVRPAEVEIPWLFLRPECELSPHYSIQTVKAEAFPAAALSVVIRREMAESIAYLIAGNLMRRHLTHEERCDVAAQLLQIAPERSDCLIARDAGVDHMTVAIVRGEKESMS